MADEKTDSLLADEGTILCEYLRKAVRARETLTIGGGEFPAKLVSDILWMYIRCSTVQGMELARLENAKEELACLRATNKALLEKLRTKEAP
jgi:hypothetical protein